MALDDLLISTGVDQLIKYLKEKGRAEIGAAASDLRLPIRTVEDWAHVLEEEGLIAIEYKLTKIYLVWRKPTAEYVAQKKSELKAKADDTQAEITELLSKVKEGGKELESMQEEVARLASAQPPSGAEAQKIKSELAVLKRKYDVAVDSSLAKLEKLKKKVDALKKEFEPKEEKAGGKNIEKEIAVLKKFESTLQAQLDDVDAFFGAFKARLDEIGSAIEGRKEDENLEQIRQEAEELKRLRNELAGAIEAIAEEYKSISGRISELDRKVSEAQSSKELSLSEAKKKLAELRKMEEEGRKQKENITAQLQSTLLQVKKQLAKFEGMARSKSEIEAEMEKLKEEYVDISEEVARAGEELSAKQKEVALRLTSQLEALDSARDGKAKIAREEIEKVSFLLRELKREQILLEEKVKLLLKEAEIFGVEGQAAEGAAAPQVEEGGEAGTFVERIKLSAEEEEEFERKRDELRALIRRMWEESKGQG
ncbi:MAG: hypothetical protein N3E51_01950 [Candidatus Micrarchaeota archaeon]|nr:hypothetical protein [Candidatus Micrarchaeota archaeon]